MSIKRNFLSSHLDSFLPNCGDYIEEQGERFYQDVKINKERKQGQWNGIMLSVYFCCPKRNVFNVQHDRKVLKKPFK